MAIAQAQADKNWQDSPSTTTPILSADLKAMSKANRDLRWFVPSSSTSIDEFDDDTLNPAWVRVDSAAAPAANATWTERGDSLSLYQAGGDSANAVRAIVQPLSTIGGPVAPGDAFVTSLHLFGSNTTFIMGGIVLADGNTPGAGSQVLGNVYNASNFTVNSWSGSNWNFSGQTSDMTLTSPQMFIRLTCLSATTWRTDASPDGVSWLLGSVLTRTITPTHVGLSSSSWGSTTKGVIKYDFLRRVSGVS